VNSPNTLANRSSLTSMDGSGSTGPKPACQSSMAATALLSHCRMFT